MTADIQIPSPLASVKRAQTEKRRRAGRITGSGAYQQASKNARFGHTRWLVWHASGSAVADRCTPENLKECLLAEGTKGTWILIHGDGHGMVGTWRIGLNVLAQMRRGF